MGNGKRTNGNHEEKTQRKKPNAITARIILLIRLPQIILDNKVVDLLVKMKPTGNLQANVPFGSLALLHV